MINVMKKKSNLFLIALCLICIMTFLIPVKAYAIAPVILAPEVITIVCGLATAAGITFATSDDAKAWAVRAWSDFSASTKQSILEAAAVGTYIVNVTKSIWDDIFSCVHAHYECSVTIAQTDQVYELTGETVSSYQKFVVSAYGQIVVSENIPVNSLSVITTSTGSVKIERYASGFENGHYIFCLKMTVIDGSTEEIIPLSYTTGEYVLSLIADGSSFNVFVDGINKYSVTKNITLSCAEFSGVHAGGQFVFYTFAQHLLVPGESYTANPEYTDNPSWDLTNKKIALPQTLDDVVGKTPDEIANPTTLTDGVTVPGATTDSATASKIADIADALTNTFTDTEIDLSPLYLVGDMVTTKFPFSLPWDFARSFSYISTPNAWNPVFHIDLNEHIAGFVFDIDLSMFSSILPYVRAFEVFCFDICLVLLTGKLMGGDV